MRQFSVQIHRMDVILMGYWISFHVATIRSSVMCNNESSTMGMALRRILKIPCELILGIQLKIIVTIDLIDSSRGRFDGLGGCDLTVEVVYAPLYWTYSFPWSSRLKLEMEPWTSFWDLMVRRTALKSLVKFVLLLPNLVLPPFLDNLVLDSSPYDGLSRLLWSSGFWVSHWSFLVRCSFHHQYYFLSLVLCSTPHFGSSKIQDVISLI